MPPRRPLIAVSAALVAAVAVGAGLAGRGGDTSLSPPPARVDLDREWAASVLLTAADLPGSTVLPSVPVDGAGTFHAAAEPCAGGDPLIADEGGRRGAAAGALVRHGPSVTVSSSAVIGRSEAESRAAMDVLNGSAFQSCFADAIRGALLTGRGFTSVTVSTAALPPLTTAGDSAGYRSTVEATGDGGTVQLYVDYVFIRSTRALAVLFDLALDTPLPDGERVRLASAMADRMAQP